MRALTWNLWGRGGDWRRRHDAIAAVIAESARAHPPRPQDGVAIGNAVLTRWPIVAGEELELPTRAWPSAGLRCARVSAPAGVLPFVTTHLTYRPGGSAIRLEQVRALAGFVAEQAGDCASPPIVTGDLNAEPVGLPQHDRGRIETALLGGNAPVNGVWPSDHFAVIADLSD